MTPQSNDPFAGAGSAYQRDGNDDYTPEEQALI